MDEIIKEDNNKTPNVDESYKSIKLDSIPYMFSERALNTLKKLNIETVGELFAVSEDQDMHAIFMNESASGYKEIVGVTRLLKCKYLGIDPLFEYDKDKVYNMPYYYVRFGFSVKAGNCLARAGVTPKELFDTLHDEFSLDRLRQLRNVGDGIAKEIIYKGRILTDFYDKKNGILKEGNDDEILILLENELETISKEIQSLNSRTVTVINMIKERLNKNKGGVVR